MRDGAWGDGSTSQHRRCNGKMNGRKRIPLFVQADSGGRLHAKRDGIAGLGDGFQFDNGGGGGSSDRRLAMASNGIVHGRQGIGPAAFGGGSGALFAAGGVLGGTTGFFFRRYGGASGRVASGHIADRRSQQPRKIKYRRKPTCEPHVHTFIITIWVGEGSINRRLAGNPYPRFLVFPRDSQLTKPAACDYNSSSRSVYKRLG